MRYYCFRIRRFECWEYVSIYAYRLRDGERATRDGKVVCEFMYWYSLNLFNAEPGNRKRDETVMRIVNEILGKEHAEGCLIRQVHLRGFRGVIGIYELGK